MISKTLKDYTVKLALLHQINAKIYYASLLENAKADLDPCCLYVGTASQVKAVTGHSGLANVLFIVKEEGKAPVLPDTLQCNLMLVYTKDTPAMVLENVREVFSGREKLLDFSEQLLDAINHRVSLSELLKTAYEYIGNPILINDTSFRLIAHTNHPDVDDPFWMDFINNTYLSSDIVSDFKTTRLYERILKSKGPVFGLWENAKYRRLISNIMIGNKIVAQLFVLEFEREFTDLDYELISLLSEVISEDMQKEKPVVNTKQTMYEYFLTDLLNGKLKDAETINERSKLFDLHLKDEYVLALDWMRLDTSKMSLVSIVNILESLVLDSKVIVYNNYIVMIFSGAKTTPEEYQNELHNVNAFLKRVPVIAGLSRRFKSLQDFQKRFQQAVKAMEIGYKIHFEDNLIKYDDVSFFHMLETYSNEELYDFCFPPVLALMQFDREHKSGYSQTLYYYIDSARKKAATADSLHVHRNTMNYRLSKIKEISGIDLTDPKVYQTCYFSLRILEYLGDLRIENDTLVHFAQ